MLRQDAGHFGLRFRMSWMVGGTSPWAAFSMALMRRSRSVMRWATTSGRSCGARSSAGRLAEDDALAVVDEQAPADPGTGMDLDAGLMPAALADPSRQKKVPALIQPVRDAVIDQNVKAGVQQNDLKHAARGGVLALDVPCVLK